MNLLGIRLTLLIGPAPLAVPASPTIVEALQSIEVTHSDRERSGFRLTFQTGRSGPLDLLDDAFRINPMLQVNARVILVVTFDIVPVVIMDGIVTKLDYNPGDKPGEGQLILSGKDISIEMERVAKQTEHPAQDETVIANKIAGQYPEYGLIPNVIPPQMVDPPIPVDRTPQQNCTDWKYLEKMAERHGYITYIKAGPLPFTNTLYWGPPGVSGLQQKALSVNLGPESNVSNINFGHDAEATIVVQGFVKDRQTGQTVPVLSLIPTRPPLGLIPESVTQLGRQRQVSLPTSGLNIAQAFARAQALLDRSSDDTFKVSGTLDSVKYNQVLRAREPVDLRGAGFSSDGTYIVRSVSHNISQGNYTQDFTLSRNETGAKVPLVRVG